MLRESVLVVVAVVRTRPRAIPLALITMRKPTHGFHEYGAPLGGPSGRRSSAITLGSSLLMKFLGKSLLFNT